MSKPAEQIAGYRRLKDPASDYKIKIIIKSYIARFRKWNDFNTISPILNQLLEKGNEGKIGRWFGKDLEMRNRTARDWKSKERLIYQKNV